MQFPAELTRDACRARRHGELRLICIYFFTDYFFQVSAREGGREQAQRVPAPPWGALQASVPLPGICAGTSPWCSLSPPLSLLGLGFRRMMLGDAVTRNLLCICLSLDRYGAIATKCFLTWALKVS